MECRNAVKELLAYTRFGICVSAMLLAVIGYLAYGGMDARPILAATAAYMFAASCYGYNNTKDKEEDLLNGKRINRYSATSAGTYVVLSCFLLGTGASAALGAPALGIYLFLSFLAWFYSYYRVKKRLLVKNAYTSLSLAALYILGASAAGASDTAGVLRTYAFIVGFVFVGSIIGDLRDISGDLAAGIRTLTGTWGEKRSKQVVYGLIALLSLQIAAFRMEPFYAALPFFPLIALLVDKGSYAASHRWYVRSFIFAAGGSVLLATGII